MPSCLMLFAQKAAVDFAELRSLNGNQTFSVLRQYDAKQGVASLILLPNWWILDAVTCRMRLSPHLNLRRSPSSHGIFPRSSDTNMQLVGRVASPQSALRGSLREHQLTFLSQNSIPKVLITSHRSSCCARCCITAYTDSAPCGPNLRRLLERAFDCDHSLIICTARKQYGRRERNVQEALDVSCPRRPP